MRQSDKSHLDTVFVLYEIITKSKSLITKGIIARLKKNSERIVKRDKRYTPRIRGQARFLSRRDTDTSPYGTAARYDRYATLTRFSE